MKRTTLVLEDGCMRQVKALARRENRQISQVVNQLLVEGLARRKKRSNPKVKLKTFCMGKPAINLGDRDALEAVMRG